jgi:hypothetical protein
MKTDINAMRVILKYYQNERPLIYYTVETKAETYMQALEICKGIAETCHGIITETRIEKVTPLP